MRTLLAALTALMLFATPVVAGDFEHAVAAYNAGNYEKAFRLWKPLAEQGDADAQYNLGLMYDYGEGVPKDDAKAVYWYRKAAEQGHAKAQFNLGWMYANGEGVAEDGAKAFSWYRKAAEQGHAKAQVKLGAMYIAGEGVPKDDVKAVNWFRKAAEQGYAKAQEKVAELEKKAAEQRDVVSTAKPSGNNRSSLSNTYICSEALPAPNHPVAWDDRSAFRSYVTEAKRRGYTPQECARILGRTTIVDDIKIKPRARPVFRGVAPTISEIDFIRRQLLDCWYLPGGAPDLPNMRGPIRG